MGWSCSSELEPWPSMHEEVLGSIPGAAKKRQRGGRVGRRRVEPELGVLLEKLRQEARKHEAASAA